MVLPGRESKEEEEFRFGEERKGDDRKPPGRCQGPDRQTQRKQESRTYRMKER